MIGRVMVDTSLPRSPKLRRLAEAVGVTPPKALGHLVSLWAEVMVQRESGVLSGWARGDLEVASAWTGKTGAWGGALIAQGWVDKSRTGELSIHDWEEHQGPIIGERAYEAAKKRRQRAHHKGLHSIDCPPNCPGAVSRDVPGESPAPSPPLPVPPRPSPAPPSPSLSPSGTETAAPDGAVPPPSDSVKSMADLIEGALSPVLPQGPHPPAPGAQDARAEVIRQLLQTAERVTTMPNKLSTLRTTFEGIIKRYGAQRLEEWLRDPKNVGKNVNELQDDLRPPRPGRPNGQEGTFTSKKSKCPHCGDSGTIAGDVVDGKILQIPCRYCKSKPETAPKRT